MESQQNMNTYRFLQYAESTSNQSSPNPAATYYYPYYLANNDSYSNTTPNSSSISSSSSATPSPSSFYYPSYYYYRYPSYGSSYYQYDYNQYHGQYYQQTVTNQCASSTPVDTNQCQPQLESLENSMNAKTTKAPVRNIFNELDDDQENNKENEEEDENEEENKGRSKQRRMRTQFSVEQRRYLLGVFRESSYPPKELLEQIAISMNVTVSVLQTWFKNTRSKQKKLTNRKNLP